MPVYKYQAVQEVERWENIQQTDTIKLLLYVVDDAKRNLKLYEWEWMDSTSSDQYRGQSFFQPINNKRIQNTTKRRILNFDIASAVLQSWKNAFVLCT